MGRYENGGSNVIGVAVTDEWAAVWTVDTPYINVLTRNFFDLYEQQIREENSRGRDFTTDDGQGGCVHAISTNGDLDASGWPKFFETASEYVAYELKTWAREDGADYSAALAV